VWVRRAGRAGGRLDGWMARTGMGWYFPIRSLVMSNSVKHRVFIYMQTMIVYGAALSRSTHPSIRNSKFSLHVLQRVD
jgi:hypothetical protein